MNEMGLAQKEQEAGNRRNRWLTLTEIGQAATQGTIGGEVEYTRSFASVLYEDEQQTLHWLLLKAARGLGFDRHGRDWSSTTA